MKATDLKKEAKKLADPKYAEVCQRFFKTGKGEYGYGDKFIGVKIPKLRGLVKEFDLPLGEAKKLSQSKIHEERMLGLLFIVKLYEKSKDDAEKAKIYKTYLSLFPYINNWDLVDVTTPKVIGRHLMDKDRKILYKWAKSKDLWTKRISIITCWWFIRKGDLKDVYPISKILLNDDHDLIHKAVGWMIREAGKKDLKKMEAFLKQHYKKMPRTMLRYAIERLPETRRQKYLKGKI